jgi:hypothetical protein
MLRYECHLCVCTVLFRTHVTQISQTGTEGCSVLDTVPSEE